ncbi:hypothetical protein [Spirosoma sp. KNUC1025]|uniref:hypothetical protein n=1 Tax=Spirosoma sp. KNUC1025 TaxID=2894082 RepID=UPI001E604C60|nr:hypothetical protein [Spirosoma sp. KNUC1025]UFH57533.1 hypothetical protein LN737_30995 [Spirosoma sp. KNUC1025]
MHPVIKIFFCIPLLINALISLFYFVMTFWSLLFPPSAYYTTKSGLIFLLGCAAILTTLGWAYNLAIVQDKAGPGFTFLALSYLLWPIVLVIMLLFSDGRWN